jgi:hypothetical protein
MSWAELLTGSLALPSGRLVVSADDDRILHLRVQPGRYRTFGTLARPRRAGPEAVALATLVLSPRATVRWRPAGSVAVDGAYAAFESAEASAADTRLLNRDEPAWRRQLDRLTESLAAHDFLAGNFALGSGLNRVDFSTGVSDGVYPVFVGSDERGRPTRVVMDFYLLHLAWPR